MSLLCRLSNCFHNIHRTDYLYRKVNAHCSRIIQTSPLSVFGILLIVVWSCWLLCILVIFHTYRNPCGYSGLGGNSFRLLYVFSEDSADVKNSWMHFAASWWQSVVVLTTPSMGIDAYAIVIGLGKFFEVPQLKVRSVGICSSHPPFWHPWRIGSRFVMMW